MQTAPKLNERVLIRSGKWRGNICYTVYSERGECIGYVPRQYIAKITHITNREWRICAVNRYTVPWKRYKISLVS